MNISASLPSRGIASNVTAENFTRKAVAFVKASDDELGFIIALRPYPGLSANEKFTPTLRQWGAWMAYWTRLPYKHKAMQTRGYATTPSEWPHEFDAMATMQGDHAAADAFERQWRDERESARFHAGGIAKQASNALALWRQTRAQRQATPASQLRADLELAIDVSDFPDANASAAELKAWEARQKERAA